MNKCLADLSPRAQAFAISLGPVAVQASPIKCKPCVYSARDPSRVARDHPRVTRSRESSSREISKCSRCQNRLARDQNVIPSHSGVHCVNISDISGHDQFTVIPHGAFIPRRRILSQTPRQRRCKWTENLDLPLDELRLGCDETGSDKSPDVTKTLPSIVLTKPDNQVGSSARQALDVKNVRLKTPPPSPVRHINVHLPTS